MTLPLILFLLVSSLSLSFCAREDPAKAAALRVKGDAALRIGQFEYAKAQYSQAINAEPSNHLNYYKRASAMELIGRIPEAIRDLNETLKRKTGDHHALQKRGKLLLESGKVEEAQKDLEQVMSQGKGTAKTQELLDSAKQIVSKRQNLLNLTKASLWPQASEAIKDLLLLIPDSQALIVEAAEICQALFDYNCMLEYAVRLIKLDPRSSKATQLRGLASFYLGDKDTALKIFQQALKSDPDNKTMKADYKTIRSFVKLSTRLEQEMRENFGEALQTAEELLQIDPVNTSVYRPSLLLDKCKCLVGLKRGKEAIEACSESIQLDESHAAFATRADAHALLEDYDKAVSDMSKASELNQNNHQYIHNINRFKKLQKMAARKDYYKIMDIPKEEFTRSKLRKKFHALAQEWHPDKYKGDDREMAEKKMQDINEAYSCLSDADKKLRYDNGDDLEDHNTGGFHHGGFGFGQNVRFNFR